MGLLNLSAAHLALHLTQLLGKGDVFIFLAPSLSHAFQIPQCLLSKLMRYRNMPI